MPPNMYTPRYAQRTADCCEATDWVRGKVSYVVEASWEHFTTAVEASWLLSHLGTSGMSLCRGTHNNQSHLLTDGWLSDMHMLWLRSQLEHNFRRCCFWDALWYIIRCCGFKSCASVNPAVYQKKGDYWAPVITVLQQCLNHVRHHVSVQYVTSHPVRDGRKGALGLAKDACPNVDTHI